jgi:acyl-CoA reductase-like NAD-dependent aldehyde dehydrogenase
MATLEQKLDHDRLFIAGRWAEPAGRGTIAVINPSSEEQIGHIPAGDAADVDAAVAAARSASETWAETGVAERARYLEAIADALEDTADELAVLIARELGMPLKLARIIQVDLPIRTFRGMAEALGRVRWSEEIGNSLVLREPVGVVAAITPWNYPLHQIANKVAAAIAAGAPVVLKPSSEVPLNAFALAEAIDRVGLPAGVVNVVTGPGSVVGEALAAHPDVDMVSFTGSTAAGRRVATLAAAAIRPVTLELGGKSANLILDDAELEPAVRDGVAKCMLNSGQTCSALSRMLVSERRLADAEAIAAEAAAALRLGDPLLPDTRLGPVVSARQREAIRAHICSGEADGARIVTGGSEPPAHLDRGFFVTPTVFSDVTPEMAIAQEEVFGPVLAMMPCRDEEDAVRIANDTPYGLSGGVWSSDPARAERVALRLRTGQVEINGGAFNPHAPFGGYKRSGFGREGIGPYAIEEFLVTKALQR